VPQLSLEAHQAHHFTKHLDRHGSQLVFVGCQHRRRPVTSSLSSTTSLAASGISGEATAATTAAGSGATGATTGGTCSAGATARRFKRTWAGSLPMPKGRGCRG